jgi:transketolase
LKVPTVRNVVVNVGHKESNVSNMQMNALRAAPTKTPNALPDPAAVRLSILDMLYRAKASHLGSSMSVVEMLIAMYGSVDVQKIRDRDLDRSRVIVSKGHCAAATYATMAHFGIIPMALLDTYHTNDSLLAGHVSHAVPAVEHSTGALGHGINVAVGCAIGLRSRGSRNSLALTLLGDGEIQEGSVWEALMLASHLKLNNFVALIDNNRISSITNTEKVLDMRPLRARFSGFDLAVHEVNGHDVSAISSAILEITAGDRAGVVVCNTVKGKGVPFAENQPIWHYRSLNDELYAQAKAAILAPAGRS